MDTTKNNKKILFVGCDLTASSMFDEPNRSQHHWPTLITDHYNCESINASIGGMPNEEIFYKTSEMISKEKFDLVIIMWTKFFRKWIYYSDDNIDDWTAINTSAGIFGHKADSAELRQITDLYYNHFNNEYIELKHWLIQIINLQNLCRQLNQPCIFIKGYENYLNDFINVSYAPNRGFSNIENISKLLNFSNSPDSYINDKINDIKSLINMIDHSPWVNLFSTAFSDDPDYSKGKKSLAYNIENNAKFADKIISHNLKNNLLV